MTCLSDRIRVKQGDTVLWTQQKDASIKFAHFQTFVLGGNATELVINRKGQFTVIKVDHHANDRPVLHGGHVGLDVLFLLANTHNITITTI